MRRFGGMVVVLMFVALMSGSLLGDDKKDPKMKGVLPPNWGKLGLSDEQKQKVYKIQGDYKEKLSDLEKQLADLKSQEKSDMEKVLSDDQKKRLRDLLSSKAPPPDEKKDPKE